MSRENLPLRKSNTWTPVEPHHVAGPEQISPHERDNHGHLHGSVKRRPGVMGGLYSALGLGDPDGTKARAAGGRGRVARPLTVGQRAMNYLSQTDGRHLTPAQRRRLVHKARQAGTPALAQAVLDGDAA